MRRVGKGPELRVAVLEVQPLDVSKLFALATVEIDLTHHLSRGIREFLRRLIFGAEFPRTEHLAADHGKREAVVAHSAHQAPCRRSADGAMLTTSRRHGVFVGT